MVKPAASVRHGISMRAVQAVFFDLDETLLDDDRYWRIAVSATCAELALRHPSLNWVVLESFYLENAARLCATLGSAPDASSGSSAHGLRVAVWDAALKRCGVEVPRL